MTLKSVTIPILDSERRTCGGLSISLLPRRDQAQVPPLQIPEEDDLEAGQPSVHLLEGWEYHYTFEVETSGKSLTTNRPEFFSPDGEESLSGRLKTGLYVGSVPVRVSVGGRELGTLEFEVRTHKLGYLDHFRWMLRDLSEIMTEVVMRSFAASEHRFRADLPRDSATLYQRFCIIRSLLEQERHQAAIRQILSSPYVTWREIIEERPPGRGSSTGSHIQGALFMGEARVHWPGSTIPGLKTLPRRMEMSRTEATIDNVPNRFVKHALEQWRRIVSEIHDGLVASDPSYSVARGLTETAAFIDELDTVLAEELFREIRPIDRFPASNQVLQRRPGYRDLFHAYALIELAAVLSWTGGDGVFSAGQRDVAKLYEYWVFFKLAGLVSELTQEPLDLTGLLEPTRSGLNLTIRSGRSRILRGRIERLGRRLDVQLFFNRSFSRGGEGSWTRTMRPDYSLHIIPESSYGVAEGVLLHFDAKYRIDQLSQVIGDGGQEGVLEEEGDEHELKSSSAVPEDLLKMHAYRDAVRRSAGAYVLYPGTKDDFFQEYHELLPGLGAFALRPTEEGDAEGEHGVRVLLEDVFIHLASHTTQHERGRYWHERSFVRDTRALHPARNAPFLRQPAADTPVLLGYVKSRAHLEWIKRTGLYNLRADERAGRVYIGSPELSVHFVLLYGDSLDRTELLKTRGSVEIHDRESLLQQGYPRPGGRLYLCLPIVEISSAFWTELISLSTVREVLESVAGRPTKGAPLVVDWQKLADAGSAPDDDRS